MDPQKLESRRRFKEWSNQKLEVIHREIIQIINHFLFTLRQKLNKNDNSLQSLACIGTVRYMRDLSFEVRRREDAVLAATKRKNKFKKPRK